MARGNNDALVRRIAAELPCRVGGGVRTVGRAERAAGRRRAGGHRRVRAVPRPRAVDGRRRRGGPRRRDQPGLRSRAGGDRRPRARDRRGGRRGGRVVIHGWKTALPITPVDAVHALEAYCDEFLYTHVDKEGLMQGTDMDAIRAVRAPRQARHRRRRHHDARGDRRPARDGRGRRRRHGYLYGVAGAGQVNGVH